MPLRWDGIADSSAQPDAVWLSRPVATSGAKSQRWKPLRKGDAQRLNRNEANRNTVVFVDGGRSRLCLETMTMEPTYPTVASVRQEVCRAVWFLRGNEPVSNASAGGNHRTPQMEFRDGTTVDSLCELVPITNVDDELRIESLYQTIVQATSSLGKGVQSILSEERDIENGTFKVQVQYKNETLSLRKVPKQQNWLSNITASTQKNSFTLQRGYSEYRVPQEELEVQLGPVRHLVFVIHGIGEAFFQRDDVQIAGLVDQTHALRVDIQKKQLARWKQRKPPAGLPPPRMEFIPIEWYHCLHGDGNADFVNHLQRITLPTISALRTIANDVLLDVLLYCTPSFCDTVLHTVVQQIQSAYTTFTKDVFPEFLTNGGTISIMGHSLGSVIAWDLLAILKESEDASSTTRKSTEPATADPPFARHAASTASSYGPPLATQTTAHLRLPFTPKYTLLLGSPVGLFLTLRNAPNLFQKDSIPSEEYPVSSFSLPTRLYNIFHPSDPVAYRIEPLLLPNELDIPPPAYLTVPGEEVRLHVKAKQLTDRVRKSFLDASQPTAWVTLVESAVSALEPSDSRAATTTNKKGPQFPLGGGADNLRVDYSLQPGLVESEYISAVTAHSSYCTHPDVQDFVLGLLMPTSEPASSV